MLSRNVMKWLKSLQMKKYRQAEGVFVAEGPKLVGELLAGGFECVCRYDDVPEEELRRVSTLESPQGVIAVFRQPHYDIDALTVMKEGLCLALDDVQNPGNLGTIVRLADWFGIHDVFCSQGCADIYNPKTVQATMGALAHVRVHYLDIAALLHEAKEQDVKVYGTFLDGENMYGKRLEQQGVIVMGNEGRGISADLEACVTEKLYIPSFGSQHTESLNVAIATAVVCAEFRRQAL